MSTYFLVYLIGYGIMIAAVWLGLDAAGIGSPWRSVAGLFLAGLGIVHAFSRAQSDTAQREQARNTRGAGGDSRTGGSRTENEGGTPRDGGEPQRRRRNA